jgi:hypothetical protein
MCLSQLLQSLLRGWPSHRSEKKKKSQSDDDDATTRLFHAFWQEVIMAPRTSYGDTDGGNVNKKHFHEPAKQAIASHRTPSFHIFRSGGAQWHTVKKHRQQAGNRRPAIDFKVGTTSYSALNIMIVIIINPSSVSCATDTAKPARLRAKDINQMLAGFFNIVQAWSEP